MATMKELHRWFRSLLLERMLMLRNRLTVNVRMENIRHWWTEWAPAWGYIPARGAGEEDTL